MRVYRFDAHRAGRRRRSRQSRSRLGQVHRGWMNLKAAVSGKSEASIIAECERGEDAALRNYENVLEENLPSDLLAKVEMYYAEIRFAHDRNPVAGAGI
jgi:uncharacterized protein (TIGR02284 family)